MRTFEQAYLITDVPAQSINWGFFLKVNWVE